MPTLTPRQKLIRPSVNDPFSTADIAANWNTLDRSPGIYPCTSTSRPSFDQAQRGRHIYETDTDLMWAWTGTAWSRVAPKGLLTTTSGAKAVGVRTSNFATTSATPVVVVSVQNVVVPPGNRTIEVRAQWSRAYANGAGYFYGRIYRSATSNSGPVLNQWAMSGLSGGSADTWDKGDGGGYSAYIRNGLPAGVYDFSLQIFITSVGSTATITGEPNIPNELFVMEM